MLTNILLAALVAATPANFQPEASTAASVSADACATTRFSVEVEGEGRDVVFIPGLASGRAVWDEAVASLDGRYRVHRVQLAGFAGEPAAGNSEGPILPGVVAQLHCYIEAEDLERPLVVGHSMGGLIALMTASAHPEDVSAIMIVDSLPFFGSLMGAPDAASVRPRADAMRDAMLAMDDAAFEQAQQANLASMVTEPDDRKAVIAMSLSSDRAVLARAMHEVMLTDMRPKLGGIEVPVTIVYPHNGFVPAAQAKRLYEGAYEGVETIRFIPVADSRHFIMLDRPERFAEILGQFVK